MDPKSIIDKVKSHKPTILGSEVFTNFAVLIPLILKEGDVHILFEVRSETLRRQPGEICFPGGKIDKQDQTPQDAAIRETEEELGIKKESISDVYSLDYMVNPFSMIVYPFVGFIDGSEMKNIDPNPSEVGELFTVPLSFFLENDPEVYQVNMAIQPEKDFPFHLIPGGKKYDWQVNHMDEYFYYYKNKTIWGLTAKIISHFIDVMKK